ncbi:hypothetical protein CDD81_1591 [Ophiocordyceps australis]|uniref:Uncharacterized protein n=1 Tax=Ophiocordyceps australis TaxID=1399860 RepID=A0A2C5Y0U7_9HYPO|nr:hypothetical protein CDD81_1591 [Ophiocordyceps australis]
MVLLLLLRKAAVSAALLLARTAVAADEFDMLRLRWRDLVLGSQVPVHSEPFTWRLAMLGTHAASLRDTFAPGIGRLWVDLPFAECDNNVDTVYSSAVTSSFDRLLIMAHAWAQQGTGLTGDAALLALILEGVDELQSQVYNAWQTMHGNWWDWQIGIPRALMDLCAILYDQLGAIRIHGLVAANNHFVPDSAVAFYSKVSTGANRVDLCRSIVFSGVMGKASARLVIARDALSPVFLLVTSGDGFYADGSFIQHTWVPYIGTYGGHLMNGLAKLFALFAGSSWAVAEANRQLFFDTVEKSYVPVIYNGLVMDGFSGRAISRGVSATKISGILENDHVRGHCIMASMQLLAESASDAESARWKAIIKGWIIRDRFAPVLSDPSLGIAELARLKRLANTSSIVASDELVGHRIFTNMDRVIHRRPGWAASVSMSSERISFYETGNGENKRGWHTGSGMLYWWGSTHGLGQYSDCFWATVNPYRLPGTTVSRKRLADGAGAGWGASKPNARWVGGSTDGKYGAIGQDIRGLQSTLTGRKSWFFLDSMIICLGAGISSTDGWSVETTYENRNLGAAGTHVLTVDGIVQPSRLGTTQTLVGAKWAQIEHFGGYLFLDDRPVLVRREVRRGSWLDVNDGGTSDIVTRRYLTLYRYHGVNPSDGGYAYAVLPGATPRQTQAAVGSVTIVENEPQRQAVKVGDFFAANFFAAGSTGGLEVSAPCSVLIQGSDIYVASPDWEVAMVHVSWQGVTWPVNTQAGVTVKLPTSWRLLPAHEPSMKKPPSAPKTEWRCGHMVAGRLHKLLKYVVGEAPLDAASYCTKAPCSDAIVDALPPLLVETIQASWNLSPDCLLNEIAKSFEFRPAGYLLASLKWYRQAAATRQHICWQSPIPFDRSDFADIFGALSAMITRPDTINLKVPLRFIWLPPGVLDAGKAYCIDGADRAYVAVREYMPNFYTESNGKREYIDMQRMRDEIDEWAGMIGRASFHLVRTRYKCPEPAGCWNRDLERGIPYIPNNYTDSWDKVGYLFDNRERFCVSFSKVDDRPSEYWIVS